MEPKQEDKRKWQRALKPVANNRTSEDPGVKVKPKTTRTPQASLDGKENTLSSRSTRLSVGKTSGTPIRKKSVVPRTSASKLPTPPASAGREGQQKQPAARAFGRSVTQGRSSSASKAAAAVAPKAASSFSSKVPTAGGAATRCSNSILGAARPSSAASKKDQASAAAVTAAGGTEAPAGQPVAERTRRRVSGQLGMDKLQSEYEALQQKLALLKRDTNRDGGRLQSTPMSAMQARKADAVAAAAGASVTVGGIMTAAAPDSILTAGIAARNHSGDTGTLVSLAALQSCENLQLQCSIPDTAGIMKSLQFLDKFPGSHLGQLASSSFNDAEFLTQCEQALSAQLQRTKDGATAQSRIAELAGRLPIQPLTAPGWDALWHRFNYLVPYSSTWQQHYRAALHEVARFCTALHLRVLVS